ncbi:MAG: glycosyltransferase [Bacteroidetes bacterium]|nr:glycosyltransferase [Bacteroidota bacterium]
MKIIHVLNHFLPEQIGGTEVYVLSLCKSLQLCNLEALVLIPNYGSTINETYYVEGIKVIKYAEPTIADKAVIMGKAIPQGLPAFVQLIKTEMPDVVHFHTIGQSIGITIHHLLEVKKAGIRAIVTFHLAGYSCNVGTLMYKNQTLCNGLIDIKRCTACSYSKKNISPAMQKVLLPVALSAYNLNYDTTNWHLTIGTAIGFPFIINQLKKTLLSITTHCDKVVVLTKWYRQVLLLNKVSNNKIVCITQGLPLQREVEKTNVGLKKVGLKLIYVGRIIEDKGLHILLNAVKQLPSDKLYLDIYAQPSNTQYALALTAQTIQYPNIVWKGVLEPSSVVNTLSGYDVLCVPSIVCEMSPLVIQEAFAAKIPVLASDVYGNAEQVTDKVNGWLFQFNNSNDLKETIQMLINYPNLIDEAKLKIPSVKTFDKVALEYKAVYDEILSFV